MPHRPDRPAIQDRDQGLAEHHHPLSWRPKARLATADVPMTANSATATAGGKVVTLAGELVKAMSPPNRTASHIVIMLRAAPNPGTRSRDAIPWRTGLSVEGSCVMTVTAISFLQFRECSSQALRPGPFVMTLTDRSKVTAGSEEPPHSARAAAASGRVCGRAYGRPDRVAAGQDYRQRPYRLSHAKDPLGQASLSGPGDHFGGEPRQEADKHRGGTGTHRRAAAPTASQGHAAMPRPARPRARRSRPTPRSRAVASHRRQPAGDRPRPACRPRPRPPGSAARLRWPA